MRRISRSDNVAQGRVFLRWLPLWGAAWACHLLAGDGLILVRERIVHLLAGDGLILVRERMYWNPARMPCSAVTRSTSCKPLGRSSGEEA